MGGSKLREKTKPFMIAKAPLIDRVVMEPSTSITFRNMCGGHAG